MLLMRVLAFIVVILWKRFLDIKHRDAGDLFYRGFGTGRSLLRGLSIGEPHSVGQDRLILTRSGSGGVCAIRSAGACPRRFHDPFGIRRS